MKEFKFKCAVDSIDNDENIIYTAKPKGFGLLNVIWEEGNEVNNCYYGEEEAKEYLENGDWVKE